MNRRHTLLFVAVTIVISTAAGSHSYTLASDDAKTKVPLPKGAIAHFEKVRSMSLEPIGNLAAMVGNDGSIRVCELTTMRTVCELQGPRMEFDSPAVIFSTNGKCVVSAGSSQFSLWDAQSGKVLRSWGGHLMHAPMAFSPDSVKVAVSGRNHEIAIFRMDGDSQPQLFQAEGNNIWSLAWSPNGDRLLSTAADGITCLWDAEKGSVKERWTVPRCACVSAFSSNGHVLACLTGDDNSRNLGLYETTTGLERLSFGRTLSFHAMAFSPDGKMVAVDGCGSEPHGIGVFDVATGSLIGGFAGRDAPNGYLAFSSDSRLLVSHNWRGEIVVWDAQSMLPKKARNETVPDKQMLQSSWESLAGDKGTEIHKAIWTFVHAPNFALPLLRNCIAERPVVATSKLTELVAELDSPNFKKRAAAMEQFKELGFKAEPFLRMSLEKSSSLEAKRRVEILLASIKAPVPPLDAEQLRWLRTLETLELIGTQAAREAIAELCEREPHPYVWRIGKLALQRLKDRGQLPRDHAKPR